MITDILFLYLAMSTSNPGTRLEILKKFWSPCGTPAIQEEPVLNLNVTKALRKTPTRQEQPMLKAIQALRKGLVIVMFFSKRLW